MNNIEAIVIAWLGSLSETSGWAVSGDKPKTVPDKYITVDRTGGPRESMVLDRAEILIEIYHKSSRMTASDLAYVIGDKIVELEAYNDNITHAAINSIINLDDTLSGYHRYQVYCDVYHRR